MTEFDRPSTFDPTYKYALAAEPDLKPLADLCRLYRYLDEKRCLPETFDVWYGLIKPWASRLVGWERGCAESADDADMSQIFKVLSGADLLSEGIKQWPAETFTEDWLRSGEAYEVVTNELCRIAGR